MRSWPFYRRLSDQERDTLRWFLFAPAGERHERGGPPPRE